MKALLYILLFFSIFLGWATESPVIGLLFAMIGYGVMWLLAAFFEALKPRRRI